MNKTKQGDIGFYAAKFHYSIEGFISMDPSSEQCKYDLVIDNGTELKRVQVKTSGYNPRGNYQVQLRTNGANYTTKNNVSKISSENVDLLFVFCMNGDCYEIPIDVVDGKSEITLGNKYEKYLVRRIGGLTITV